MVDGAGGQVVGRRAEGRGAGGFLPGLPEVGGAEEGRAKMPGLGRRQQRAAVTRVERQVIDDMAEKVRAVGPPRLAGRVAVIEPGTLAGRHQKNRMAVLRAWVAHRSLLVVVNVQANELTRIRSVFPARRSAVPECRLALFDEGGHAFLLVFQREGGVKDAAFEQQAFVQR